MPSMTATQEKKHKRMVDRLRRTACCEQSSGVIKVAESLTEAKVPLAECEARVTKIWEILKAGVLDPEKHKDAWIINTAEAQSSRGQFGDVLHPKWQPAPDTYFYHDAAIDALVVLDRTPVTVSTNKGQPKLIGIKREEVCCCDSEEHKAAKKFKMPLINRGDCRRAPLPHLEGVVT